MSAQWLSLRDLEYIVRVAEFENFGRAAAFVNVSQPALSLQIKKIEGILGVQLFERTKRRVIITEHGREFVTKARRVLEEAETLNEIGKKERPFQLPFRLGAIQTAGPYLMPLFLPKFFKKIPGGQLLIREGLTEELVELLKSGDLDAVIASPTFNETGFVRKDLYFEPFRLLLPKGHRLAAKKPLTTRDLNSSEMVLLEDGHCLRDQSIGICAPSRRTGVRNFHVTSLDTLRYLVAAGQGYAIFPELAFLGRDRFESLVVSQPVQGHDVGRLMCLYVREGTSRMEESETLAAIIREALPEQVDVRS